MFNAIETSIISNDTDRVEISLIFSSRFENSASLFPLLQQYEKEKKKYLYKNDSYMHNE